MKHAKVKTLKLMRIIFITIIFLLLAFSVNAQEINPKTLERVELKIVQSGTLQVSRYVQSANLSYYIPQEGVKSINVSADGDMTWRYTYDEFNNKLILLEWKKPSGTITYSIELIVENTAKHTYTEKPVGTDPFYLKETKYVQINDAIRELAFPYEKSMKRAAELTKFVYEYLEYDLSYVGKNVPSDQVLQEKRGVCVEHSNLLAALLRASGIPNRYVVGYAYSSVQKKFIGHTWNEVLAADGTWVPFDPTWLQAGYLDATHLKSAALLDNSQIDTLTYLGGGIDWTRNEEQITLLDYTENKITSLSVSGTEKVAQDNYGYIRATLSTDQCILVDINANSCVDGIGGEQFAIQEAERIFWTCGTEEVYWFFKTKGNNYICPVSIYDQTGGEIEYRVTVRGQGSDLPNIFISGPDTADVNEQFTLTASTDGIFYSPEFGLHSGRIWTLNAKHGMYKFYLYYFGALYVKTVNVVQEKEFDLNVVSLPLVKLDTLFDVNATVKNLLDARNVLITIQYTNQTVTRTTLLNKNEEKTFSFKLSANTAGLNDLIASVSGDSLASQTIAIETPEEKTAIGGIIDAIINFFGSLIDAIGSLFSK